jgi:hypothetical protein
MKIKDIKHLPLETKEVLHYQKYLGGLVIDQCWAYDSNIPDDFPHRYSKALIGFAYQAASEILKVKERLGETAYRDLLRRDQ